MIERSIEIVTPDGRMSTFICHPERDSPHPAIIIFMDAPGIREELRDMARRLGTVGYYVMLPNLYYRSGVEELGPFVGEAHAATRARRMRRLLHERPIRRQCGRAPPGSGPRGGLDLWGEAGDRQA